MNNRLQDVSIEDYKNQRHFSQNTFALLTQHETVKHSATRAGVEWWTTLGGHQCVLPLSPPRVQSGAV